MRLFKTCALCFALLALAVPTAQADTIATFDFNFAGAGGINPTPNPFTAASNPAFSPAVQMQITASGEVSPIPLTTNVTASAFQSGAGLGVTWSGLLLGLIPVSDTVPGEVEQFGAFETLNLTFGSFDQRIEDAVVTSITFSNIQDSNIPILDELILGDDDIRVLLNGVQVGGIIDPNSNGLYTFTFNSPLAITGADVLSFQAPGGNDDFSVLGLTVQANVVPEPASLALWTMLGGVGLAAWRKRKAKQIA